MKHKTTQRFKKKKRMKSYELIEPSSEHFLYYIKNNNRQYNFLHKNTLKNKG